MAKDGHETRFDPRAELVTDGYDMGMARARALEHAQKNFGRRWFRKLPLIWKVESAGYDENADCYEIVVSCHPEGQEANRGEWEYHVGPDSRKLLPGTPLVRSQIKQNLSRRDKAKNHVDRGIAHRNNGEFDLAIDHLGKAIEMDPDLTEAYIYRGDVYLKKGHYERAIADFSRAIGLQPNSAKAYSWRATAYQQKAQYTVAFAYSIIAKAVGQFLKGDLEELKTSTAELQHGNRLLTEAGTDYARSTSDFKLASWLYRNLGKELKRDR